jgi:hypothetical protein
MVKLTFNIKYYDFIIMFRATVKGQGLRIRIKADI